MSFLKAIGRIVGGTWWVIKGFMVIVLTLIFYIALLSFIGALQQGQPKKVPYGAALVINPQGTLVEQKTAVNPYDPATLFQGAPSEVLVYDVVEAIDRAAEDKQIKVLVLNLAGLNVPWAYASKAYHIADAVERFKASGKEVIALDTGYYEGSYLIASHADEIWMDPFGAVFFQGYQSNQTYLGSLYKNLKVNIHVFRSGKYKSALETYSRDDMSPAAKEAIKAVLDDSWKAFLGNVSAARGLSPEDVQAYADEFVDRTVAGDNDIAKVALEAGLVDKLKSSLEWREALIEKVGKDKTAETFKQISMTNYLRATAKKAGHKGAGNKGNVAVVVAKGTIVMGEAPRGTAGGDTIARLIRNARKNSNTKAIVLRVDSPGGAAFGSEIIRREIVAAKADGIPVVVSMGSLAASGGYWISADGDKIFAEPTTITGSIGVLSMFPTMEELGDWAGIHGDGVGTTTMAGALDPFRPIHPELNKLLQSSNSRIYDDFIGLVANGRGLEEAYVREIAEGRVWSAEDALEIGLVDEIGSIYDAIDAAASMAKIEKPAVNYFEEKPTPFQQFMEDFAKEVKSNVGLETSARPLTAMDQLILEVSRTLVPLAMLNDPNNAYLICEVCEVY